MEKMIRRSSNCFLPELEGRPAPATRGRRSFVGRIGTLLAVCPIFVVFLAGSLVAQGGPSGGGGDGDDLKPPSYGGKGGWIGAPSGGPRKGIRMTLAVEFRGMAPTEVHPRVRAGEPTLVPTDKGTEVENGSNENGPGSKVMLVAKRSDGDRLLRVQLPRRFLGGTLAFASDRLPPALLPIDRSSFSIDVPALLEAAKVLGVKRLDLTFLNFGSEIETLHLRMRLDPKAGEIRLEL